MASRQAAAAASGARGWGRGAKALVLAAAVAAVRGTAAAPAAQVCFVEGAEGGCVAATVAGPPRPTSPAASSSHPGVLLMQLNHGGLTQLALQRAQLQAHHHSTEESEVPRDAQPGLERGLVKNWRGLCLDAPGGGRVQMWLCDAGAASRIWTHDPSTGQLRNEAGGCLVAPQRNAKGSSVYTGACDDRSPDQQWAVDHVKGEIRNRQGICVDASDPTRRGSDVHLWTCDTSNPNQRFASGGVPMPSLPMPNPNAAVYTIKHPNGLCLDSGATEAGAGELFVFSCVDGYPSQLWSYVATSGEITNTFGTCLTASAANDPAGVQLSACSGGDGRQQWTYDSSSRLLLSKSGVCLHSPYPDSGGTMVQATYCSKIPPQTWLMEVAPAFSTSTATTTLPSTTATSTTSRSTTTSTTTTMAAPSTTGAQQVTTTPSTSSPARTTTTAAPIVSSPLTSVRNCYLLPLETGMGCQQLAVFQGPEYERNKYGQETSGKQACLKEMRTLKGDSFVFFEGWCEVWSCGSRAVLRSSSGVSPVASFGVLLQSFHGKYLIVGSDGHVSATGDSISNYTKFQISDNSDGTVALQTVVGTYVAADDGGQLWANSGVLSQGARFAAVYNPDGTVSLRSFRGLYLSAELSGSVAASRPGHDTWESFVIIRPSPPEPLLTRPQGQSWVYSELCQFQEALGGLQGDERRAPVFVNLWEWNFVDVARECREHLGPNGFDAVQVSPVAEHIVGAQWWTKYQPVSAGLNSRSGTEDEFREMVAACRAAGVQVMVDILFNHMASPCAAASRPSNATPCQGWNGTHFGNRRSEGAKGWDTAGPEDFHHVKGQPTACICNVGPSTGWLCPNNDCTPCDMYGMPDWNSGLKAVQDKHAKHVEELYSMGVTMLRIDAAIYQPVKELASILNRVPWDYVYMEWWGEYPIPERHNYVGHYRDVAFRWKICDALATKNASQLSDVLQVTSGVFGITPEMAVYPMLYHDGRSAKIDQGIATYKNGLEYHQQQKFFLAWPWTSSVMLWGSYGWTSLEEGPPGCELGGNPKCKPTPLFDASGSDNCMPTPTESPMPAPYQTRRSWVCEHRWQGVAGMIGFRKACHGLALTQTWTPEAQPGLGLGRLAFRLGADCFVGVVKGYNNKLKPDWGHLGDWSLQGLALGLPKGRYCDASSLTSRSVWDRRSCPREVVLGDGGLVLSGYVPEGDILAIHTGAMLDS